MRIRLYDRMTETERQTLTQFSDLGLGASLLKTLAVEQYTVPTPIQAQAIPHVLAGKDLLGIAQTGTGKTAAFALPILQGLMDRPAPLRKKSARVLVLSPTRELAGQIADSFRTYARNDRRRITAVVGGVPIGKQMRALADGVDVLIATPGRLLDLVDQRALKLDAVEVLVLDEADQMLDLGFIHALRRIVTLVPADRQTLFFSATMPKPIADLAANFLTDPVKVAVTPVAKTADRVKQGVYFVETGQKMQALLRLLADPAITRALVFTRTKHGADKVARILCNSDILTGAIHGNKSQAQRERALAGFRAGRVRVLVATDIAARGIDVDGVSHVINYDLPNVPESYVHRIGRTARAGAEGTAVSFCNGEERAYLRDIERLTKLRVPVLDDAFAIVPGSEGAYEETRPAPRQQRGSQGQRRHNGAGQARHGQQRNGQVQNAKRDGGFRPKQGKPFAKRGDQRARNGGGVRREMADA